MEQVVDSTQEQLPGPVIIAMSVEQLHQQEGLPKQALMLSIAKETTMEDADVVQIGNTVFLTHLQEQKGKLYGVGRAFNVDTARNFVDNGFKFFTYLQEKGVQQYITYYRGSIYDQAFDAFKRRADRQAIQYGGTRTKFVMRPAKNGAETYVVITFGTEPLE